MVSRGKRGRPSSSSARIRRPASTGHDDVNRSQVKELVRQHVAAAVGGKEELWPASQRKPCINDDQTPVAATVVIPIAVHRRHLLADLCCAVPAVQIPRATLAADVAVTRRWPQFVAENRLKSSGLPQFFFTFRPVDAKVPSRSQHAAAASSARLPLLAVRSSCWAACS